MRFQRAEPELNGFGVTTWTPGFTRSAQVLMCLGLPLRTTKTTTESVTMPWSGPTLSHLGETRPALTNLSMSGSSEKLTTSAAWPLMTLVAWVPEGPNDPATV